MNDRPVNEPQLAWYHAVLGTHASWLPGCERGFRSRRHRIHSSGDYRNPPPSEEHAGLRAYHAKRSATELVFDPPARQRVVSALRDGAAFRKLRLLAVSAGAIHCHLVVELSSVRSEAKRQVGALKNGASYLLRDLLPGRIWAAGASLRIIDRGGYLRQVFWYVFTGQEAGAANWADLDLWRELDPEDPGLRRFIMTGGDERSG